MNDQKTKSGKQQVHRIYTRKVMKLIKRHTKDFNKWKGT